MSHSHEDRVADRPADLCAAYGCPLHGTMTSSTSGSADWWCALHFGKDAAQLQAITSAMNRYRWLVQAIFDVRANSRPKVDWRKQLERIEHDFRANHRADLCVERFPEGLNQGKPCEKSKHWIVRLEAALMAYVAADVVPAVVTQGGLLEQSTWSEARDALPEPF